VMDEGMARVSREPSRVYRHFREVFGDRRPTRRRIIADEDQPFRPGRDPHSVSGAMDKLSADMGWSSAMAEASIALQWVELVGENIADHTEVLDISSGTLTVACDSSAWATQLRMMRHDLLVRFGEQVPEARIEKIVVKAPGAPSWRKGPRSVPGRGPRDTYG
jgi:predicted nucleic acid-binding Zn ribbon protein